MLSAEPIKLVSWDVDGTLYSIRRMKRQLGLRTLGEVARGRGLLARRELSALVRYREQVDAARLSGGLLEKSFLTQNRRAELIEVEKRWYGPAIQQVGPRAGIAEVISFLAQLGVTQVVISDYEATYKLEVLGLVERFASIYVGERLGFVKPNPLMFQRAAADFEASARSCLHIGDRLDRDHAAADAAGWQCLILGSDYKTADELLNLLRVKMFMNPH